MDMVEMGMVVAVGMTVVDMVVAGMVVVGTVVVGIGGGGGHRGSLVWGFCVYKWAWASMGEHGHHGSWWAYGCA